MKLRLPTVADLHERRGRHLQRGRAYRIGVALTGVVLILAGIPLLVLPGPAFLLFAVGLGLLALEFTWAARALAFALERAHKASRAVKDKAGRGERAPGSS